MACPMSSCVIGHSFEHFNGKGCKRPTYPVEVKSSNGCENKVQNNDVIPSQLSLPVWFDRARFENARAILGEYFMSIFLCHLSGLVLLVFIKSIYTTLALSGKSRDLVSIFYRYLHTIMHVKLWYEGKVYEVKDDAYHSLLKVKQMHQSVANMQNRHKKPNEDRLALSQRDMALTQFAFIGLIILHPEKMGFSGKIKNLERLIYFWRVIGHLLGIEDEYNLCNGDYATVRGNCAQIWERKFTRKLISMRKEAAEMSEQIVLSASHYVWLLRYRGLLKYLFEVTQLPTSSFQGLKRVEELFYYSLKLTVGTLLHYRLLAPLFNGLLRFAFYRVITSKSFVSAIVRSLETLQNRYYL